MRYEILGIDLRQHYGQWMWSRERAMKAVQNYADYLKAKEKAGESLEDYWRRTGECLEFIQRTGDGYSSIKYWIPPRTHVMADNNWLDVKGYANKWGFKTENSEPLLMRVIETLARPGQVVLDFFLGSGTTAAVAHKTGRRWIGIEMGGHFDTVAKRRLEAVLHGERSGISIQVEWAGGGMFKYIRLESYEDALNNLAEPAPTAEQAKVLSENPTLREDYMLHYMLDVETRGSPSLLSIDAFTDPTAYRLKAKRPGADEYETRPVDLLETFNYLLGLRVEHLAAPQTFAAEFERPADPELPEDQRTRLQITGKIKQDAAGPWWFRKVEGWLPRDRENPSGADHEKVLVVWRRLTGDLEKDNAVLDAWFEANRISTRDWEFDTIYVNGSNNLPNLLKEGDTWKVRLIEEDFHRLMWDVEDV
jgi:adenine-specific DNA-methyltransferase